MLLWKPSFKKIKKIMENSIIGRGGVSNSNANSIIQKNTVYFNTRPLFEVIKLLIYFKIFQIKNEKLIAFAF